MEVYLDLVILLNFLVDFLLLLGTNRLSGFPPEICRTAAAAALGGLYGGACLLPEFRFLGNLLWRMVSLSLMSVIAFGWNRSSVKRAGVFVLLSMALGGIAVSFGRGDFAALLLAAGAVWLLCRAAFGECVGGREYVPLEITYGEKHVNLIALRDSGNTLRDPITGEQVLILSSDAAEELTGLTARQLASPLETLACRPVPGLRLIPYRAVGSAGGFLLGLRFEDVKIGSRKQSAIVAFAAEGLGRGEVYQALTGGA
ncbi:MAG: sigma-E processing peptidase SpoIIGA [Oscillospiraceae bacterium]|nr:sigma-E processing peptidase SpoIIGA [Oscillospiraceae bacterium]